MQDSQGSVIAAGTFSGQMFPLGEAGGVFLDLRPTLWHIVHQRIRVDANV